VLRLDFGFMCDIGSLLHDIRPADLTEWQKGTGHQSIREDLSAAIIHPNSTIVTDEAGQCIAAWGVSEKYPGSTIGSAWMVATNQALRRVHEMHRFFKIGIREMHERFPIIHATAWAENTVHHKWMEHFGFVRQPGIITIHHAPFILFTRRKQ